MLEIKGKVTTAICYANVIEEEAMCGSCRMSMPEKAVRSGRQ